MVSFAHWAARWGVPQEAVNELMRVLLAETPIPYPTEATGKAETVVQQAVRLEASREGCRLWRNNVGAFRPPEGGLVRYGLCNESKRMNEQIKSSDLIGIRPVIITPELVGRTVGQFLARETKRSDWKYKGTARERAQLKFNELVLSLGGDAAFSTGRL